MRSLLPVAGALLGAAVLVAGCSASGDGSADPGAAPPVIGDVPLVDEPALDECSTENLTVVNPGQLTVGARSVDVEPLFRAGDPSTGEGFDAALTYEIASALGFERPEVSWVVLEPRVDPFLEGSRVDFVIGQVLAAGATDSSVASDPYLTLPSGEESYVLLLAAGNPLVTCVNGALAEIDASGEVAALADEWLRGSWLDGSVAGAAARVS